ncbi:MAG: BolA family protein [Acidithiobacillus sp.]
MSKALLESQLRAALHPELLEIKDRSEAHSAHEQSAGGGHYEILVVTEQFQGLALLARHRLVYAATAGVPHIHALSIKAMTPAEMRQQAAAAPAPKAFRLAAD